MKNKFKVPYRKRQPLLSWGKEQELKEFRKTHLKQGKTKLSIMYEREKGKKVSSWQFQRVIQKYQLYENKIKAERLKTEKVKNKGAKRLRISGVKPPDYVNQTKPFFFCLDTIVLYLLWSIKRYIFTAVEYFHKIS